MPVRIHAFGFAGPIVAVARSSNGVDVIATTGMIAADILLLARAQLTATEHAALRCTLSTSGVGVELSAVAANQFPEAAHCVHLQRIGYVGVALGDGR